MTSKKKLLTLTLTVLVAGLMGCAEHKSKQSDKANQNPQAAPPGGSTIDPTNGRWVPNGEGPGEGPGADWVYGGAAPLDLVSVSRLEEYTMQPRNNPKNVRVNLNLQKFGSKNYGGTVSISYDDFGIPYEGNFTSGDTKTDNKYNVWLEKDGKRAYHGFFEDGLGAIIVVIDDFTVQGDGEGPGDNVGGRIYFKNFDPNLVPDQWTFYPGYTVERAHCWFISRGPNDCRAWKSGKGVDTYRAIYPDSGYKLLGTFEDLSLDEAFNGEVDL